MCRGLSGETFSVCPGGDTGRRKLSSYGSGFRGCRNGRLNFAVTWSSAFGTWTLSDVDREGTEVEPEWLAKPGKRSGPIVSAVEGRDSDIDRGSGRRNAVLSGDDGGCRLVEAVTGKPGPALWTGAHSACGMKTRANRRSVRNRGAGSEPSGEGQAPRWNTGRRSIESEYADRHRGGNRRSGHRNR